MGPEGGDADADTDAEGEIVGEMDRRRDRWTDAETADARRLAALRVRCSELMRVLRPSEGRDVLMSRSFRMRCEMMS